MADRAHTGSGVLTERVTMKSRTNSKKSILDKRTNSERILFAIVFAFFAIYVGTMVFSLLWMLMSSFKNPYEYDIGDRLALPEKFLFRNYIDAFQKLNSGDLTLIDYFGNSVWYVALCTFLTTIIPCLTGYIMAKYEFPGRRVIFTLAIISMTLPIVGTTAAYMKFITVLNLYDSPMFAVVANLGGFGGMFLVYEAFFKSVPWSYAESAKIDGANNFVICFKIMLPQARSIMLTYVIINSIAFWNEYQSIILYMPSYLTLAAGLFVFKSQSVRDGGGNDPLYFAGLIITMIPAIIVFLAFSEKIMESLSIGGLKG